MLKIAEDEIKSIAKRVVKMTLYNAERDEAIDNADYLAYEILDLSELMCANFTSHNCVIREILKYDGISDQAKQIIRKLS